MDICSSPKLFAAYHVLLRLREPRHPPCALIYFFLRLIYKGSYKLLYTGLIYTRYIFTCSFLHHVKDRLPYLPIVLAKVLWRITDSNR